MRTQPEATSGARRQRPSAVEMKASLGFAVLHKLCLLACLALVSGAFAAPDPEAERARLEVLREKIGGLHQQIRSKSGEKTQLTQALAESEKSIGRLARKLRELDARLSQQRRRLKELQIEQQAQGNALNEQRSALARQVRAAYAMGRQEQLKILLNQQDPATVSRMMVYFDYLNRARAQKMAQIRDQLEKLAQTERQIASGERQLAVLLDEQNQELEAMRMSQQQRRDLVVQLTRDLKDQGRQLDRLKSDERDLQTLIRGLEEALSDIPAAQPQELKFAKLRGRLPWPAKGRLVHRFGAPKLGSMVWDGVMISAPEGGEVRAIHYGRVAFADWLRGFGLLLIVDHGGGYMTLYGHNQSLFKEVGDWVEANEPLALVGSSGGQADAGVYFGIRHQGRPVNPAKWCRRPKARRVG